MSAASTGVAHVDFLWAKTTRQKGDARYHPLWAHLLDTLTVGKAIWSDHLPAGVTEHISASIGYSEDQLRALSLFLAATHDLGKASPSFQRLNPPFVEHFKSLAHTDSEAETLCSALHGDGFEPHGTITAATLGQYFVQHHGWAPQEANLYAIVTGGHHGVFPRAGDWKGLQPSIIGGKSWSRLRDQILDIVVAAIPLNIRLPEPRFTPEACAWIAGFVVLCDWLASATRDHSDPTAADDYIASYPNGPRLQHHDYLTVAEERVRATLARSGWLKQNRSTPARPFAELADGYEPRAIQEGIISATAGLSTPACVVIEAPTGIGKTESALELALRLNQTSNTNGIFFGLPTRATTEAMFRRLADIIARIHPDTKVNLQLLHGSASISAAMQTIDGDHHILKIDDVCEDHERQGGPYASSWFANSKRGLLSTYGVGTVDQILMAGLQAKFGSLRLYGLAGKCVIIDEIHAYDEYMVSILEVVLRWLRGLGTNVILLSATLPQAQTRRLLAAYGEGAADGELAPYPRVSWTTAGQFKSVYLGKEHCPQRTIELEHRQQLNTTAAVSSLATEVSRLIENGGCVGVLLNTVNTAQEFYRAIKPLLPVDCAIDLYHARFPQHQREQIHARVEKRYGKGEEHRPKRGVLIATQVIEQSIDLDLDLLITELAPIDLLLQRAGRMHRHDRQRPDGFEKPRLLICGPETETANPTFSKTSTLIYNEFILWRTWYALRSLTSVCVPNDVEALIEAVYGPLDYGSLDAFEAQRLRALQKLWNEEGVAANAAAAVRTIEHPDRAVKDLTTIFASQRAEKDEVIERLVLTRLGGGGRAAICLPNGLEYSAMERTDLLALSIPITNPGLSAHLEQPKEWQRDSILRSYALIEFDSLGYSVVNGRTLQLEPELGLVIHRKGPRAGV